MYMYSSPKVTECTLAGTKIIYRTGDTLYTYTLSITDYTTTLTANTAHILLIQHNNHSLVALIVQYVYVPLLNF